MQRVTSFGKQSKCEWAWWCQSESAAIWCNISTTAQETWPPHCDWQTADWHEGHDSESNWTAAIQQLFAQLWSDKPALVLGWRWAEGCGLGLSLNFFFSFFTGLFLFPPAVGGCHWSMGHKAGRETWRVTWKLRSVPDGLSLLPGTARPRAACSERSAAHRSLCTPRSVSTDMLTCLPLVSWLSTIWNRFLLNRRWDRRLQQKLSLDEIRSSMQQRQATTWMEYTAGSQCNYL